MSWIRDTDREAAQATLRSNSYNSQNSQNMPFPVAAAIMGGASILGSLFGASSQSQTNAMNLKMMREQNAFNAQQALENRNFQQIMTERQNDWNKLMWDYTFEKENAYNSPVQQMRRLAAAGINPYVAAADIAKVTSSSSLAPPVGAAAPSGSVASSSGLVPMQAPNYLGNVFGNLAQVAQAFKLIADAKKSGIDTKILEGSAKSLVIQEEQKARLAKITADLQAEFGSKIQQATLNKFAAEIENLWSDKAQKEKSIEKLHNETLELGEKYLKAKADREAFEKMVPDIIREQTARANQQEEAVRTQREMTKTERSKQSSLAAGASASLATAQNQISQANSTRELLAGAKRLQSSQEFGNNVQSLNALYDLYSKIMSFPDEWKRKHYEALKVFKDVDWYDTDKSVENVTKIMDTFFKGLDSVSGFIPFTR